MDQRHQDLADFTNKFRVNDLHLANTQGWSLSLRPGQPTLASMVLSVHSGTRDLAALTADEAVGMGQGFGLAERLARETFGAVRINILCLMMQDPIVHFHILPRYDQAVDYANLTWKDIDWPGPPQIIGDPANDDVLESILIKLRSNL